jgi:hypothetical protein
MDTDVGELRPFSSAVCPYVPGPSLVAVICGLRLGDFPKVGIEGEPLPIVVRFIGEALPFLPGLL